MNKDQWVSLSTVLIALIAPQAMKYGISSDQLANVSMGLFSIAVVGWNLWHNWKLRKVPETSVVSHLAVSVASAKAQSIPEAK